MRPLSRSFLVGLAGAACFPVGVATSQHTAPTDNKGVTQEVVTSLDLGDQIEGMAGRQLRMRKVVIEPGGHVALHEHTNRPALVFIQEGEFTDHRMDGTS